MMDAQTTEDSFLLLEMQNGNRRAFDRLFQKYYSILCAYCYRYVSLQDAEDIVQDVMLWMWENRDKMRIDYSLKQYLFASVYRRSMTKIEQDKTSQRILETYHEDMLATLCDMDVFQINELSKHIRQAIEQLPPAYKEAFVMHRFHKLSYKDIAEKLNVSPKTVDYRIQQSLKILRVQLKDYLPLLIVLLGN